ncbi:plasminogen receptor (KT) [Tachysurus ichikawai]
MGIFASKVMDQNLKKQQEFMLHNARMQIITEICSLKMASSFPSPRSERTAICNLSTFIAIPSCKTLVFQLHFTPR